MLYAFVRDGAELVQTFLETPPQLVQGVAPAKLRAEAGGVGELLGERHPAVGLEPERGSTSTDKSHLRTA